MKLLIVEDEKTILNQLLFFFKNKGNIVDFASNGLDAEYMMEYYVYDVIILDWMLPEKSGVELLEFIRKRKNLTPVIMLTAKTNIKERVAGLRMGCDDYLVKPFNLLELEARVEALYRRTLSKAYDEIIFKNIRVNLQSKEVFYNDSPIFLSMKEYELLLFLIKNQNTFVSKYNILEQLWSSDDINQSNVVEVTIFNLRKKLSKDLIKNFRGFGYKIETH